MQTMDRETWKVSRGATPARACYSDPSRVVCLQGSRHISAIWQYNVRIFHPTYSLCIRIIQSPTNICIHCLLRKDRKRWSLCRLIVFGIKNVKAQTYPLVYRVCAPLHPMYTPMPISCHIRYLCHNDLTR